jgi:hypothetical protein
MALLAILFGQTQTRTSINRIVTTKDAQGKPVQKRIGSFVLDVMDSEKYTGEVEPTANPVEEGVQITDHIIEKPDKLSISGFMSFEPDSANSQLRGLATAVGAGIGTALAGPLAGAAGGIVSSFVGKTLANTIAGPDRTLTDVVDELVNIKSARLPVEIVTGLKVYKDMVLVSFDVTRNNSDTTGTGIKLDLNFQQIRFANSRIVRVKLPASAVAHTANGREDQGRQNTTDPNDGQGKKSSLALQGIQKLGFLQ